MENSNLISFKEYVNKRFAFRDLKEIRHLNIFQEQLKDLDGIEEFSNLLYLNCQGNPIYNLPKLPETLSTLHCSDCKLVELSELPKNLEFLFCDNNDLELLPELPRNLKTLEASTNNLTELNSLPSSLNELNISSNSKLIFTESFRFPQNLIELEISRCGLKVLPELPNKLELLHCSYNNFTYIKKLPKTLLDFKCINFGIFDIGEIPIELSDITAEVMYILTQMQNQEIDFKKYLINKNLNKNNNERGHAALLHSGLF